ncbi:MAG: hypothetical protein C5B47_06855 [Verrucomicrobia bacterium]|nr:MAG: hypothetical protein C5B47_06855 [Verrucomicrobiota bacterium]
MRGYHSIRDAGPPSPPLSAQRSLHSTARPPGQAVRISEEIRTGSASPRQCIEPPHHFDKTSWKAISYSKLTITRRALPDPHRSDETSWKAIPYSKLTVARRALPDPKVVEALSHDPAQIAKFDQLAAQDWHQYLDEGRLIFKEEGE